MDPAFLLVDDDAYLIETLVPLLKKAYPGTTKVIGALSYQQALDHLDGMPAHSVVISDFDLREARDGADLLAEVELRRPQFGRILISGHSRETLAYAFVRCRPHAFVQKSRLLEDMIPALMTGVQQAVGTKPASEGKPDEALRQSSEIYRLLVESVQDYAIFVLDPTGHIASWNPGAERIKGYTAKEVLGKHFRMFYTADDQNRKHPEAELQIALAHGRYEEEGVRVRRDGSRFWANIVLTPLHGPDGTHRGFAKVTRDLTARKATEDQMRRHARELEELSQELEAFSYTVAHDLRSPLRALINEIRLAEKEPQSARQHHAAATKQALQMAQLIDDLLVLAQANKDDLQLQPIDVTTLAREAADAIWKRAGRDPNQVNVQSGMTLRADPRGMRIVLDNLLSNALKFTAATTKPAVEVGAMRTPQGHVAYVRDNGVGFDPALAGRLFRPFQRLHAGSEGTGLGLATVRRVIERHGGRVWIDAKPDQGATAYFLLHSGESLERNPTLIDGSHVFRPLDRASMNPSPMRRDT